MKAIKFNLSYGDERIKTFDELKDKCNIDMLLETLENGQLVRWLVAQEELELAKKVGAINTDDKRKACGELLKLLFDKDASIHEQTAAELFSLREQEKRRLESLKELENNEREIIVQYHNGYENTLEAIKTNADDYPKLKALMKTLYGKYERILELDKGRFYREFKNGYPLVLLALIANEDLRQCFSESLGQIYEDLQLAQVKREPLSLPSHVKKFMGKTESYWKDIEPKGKRFMIISMEPNNKVRSAGASGEELNANDINGKFPITDGIDYMSNNENDPLIYMEV